MATYISKSEVLEFLLGVNPNAVIGDITDLILNQAWSIIEKRTGRSWSYGSEVLTLNGNGESFIFVPKVPIVSLSSIVVTKSNMETTTLTLTGSERDVWWDTETGRIQFVTPTSSTLIFYDRDDIYDVNKFSKGYGNIAIVGIFGEEAPDMIKYLQTLLILKALTFQQSKNYKSDVIMEQIGKYEYRIGTPSGQAVQNQYRGLDGTIEFIFSLISNVADIQAI